MKNLKLKFDVEGRPELTTAIQTRLFALGYAWAGEKRIQYINKPFIYCEYEHSITYGDDRPYFNDHECRLATLQDLYDIPLLTVTLELDGRDGVEVTKEQLEKALEKFND